MAKELSLTEARKNSASFLYIFASDKYLSYIPKKYANVIRGKRANQRKLLTLSAQAYINKDAQYGGAEYKQYVDAVQAGFLETYGIKPVDALVKLALGEEVAGKNWKEGVFGVGALYGNTFKNVMVNDQAVTVDPQNGHIFAGSEDITDNSKTVYKEIGGKTIPYQLFSQDGVFVFMSQYYKVGKKYYAKTYSDNSGSFSASDNASVSATDAASIFENVQLGTNDFLSFIKSLLAFFGINVNWGNDEMINEKNTLPNQQADGYVQESGMSEAAAIALMAVAGGTLLAGGFFKKGKKKNK